MANWTTILIDDLNAGRLSDLIAAAQTTTLGTNNTDPIPETIQKVVDELRGSIAFSGRYPLDADPAKIPVTLRDMAVQKIARLLKGRLTITLNKDEESDERTYQKRLEQLNQAQWPVPQPDTPLATPLMQPTQGVTVATSRTRLITRDGTRGL